MATVLYVRGKALYPTAGSRVHKMLIWMGSSDSVMFFHIYFLSILRQLASGSIKCNLDKKNLPFFPHFALGLSILRQLASGSIKCNLDWAVVGFWTQCGGSAAGLVANKIYCYCEIWPTYIQTELAERFFTRFCWVDQCKISVLYPPFD